MKIHLNGRRVDVAAHPMKRLLDVLREDCGLTGTKEGCGVGVCGLCSVLVDSSLVSACLVPAVTLDGASVETIEGCGNADGSLSVLQESFIRHGGFQCGICTPGQIVAAMALLQESPQPSDVEIREWMTGNLCRCTGYEGIARAIAMAADEPGAT